MDDPRDDYQRARRLYQAYQAAKAAGKTFTPDSADVEAFKRTYSLYQQHSQKPKEQEESGTFDRIRRGFNEFDQEITLGVTDAITNAAEGIGKLTGWEGLSKGATSERERLEEKYDPDSDTGGRFLTGRTLGRFVGEGATAVAGGGLVVKGLSKIPATRGLAQRILKLQRTRAPAAASAGKKAGAIATRAVGQVAPIAPLDLAIGAGQAEEGESPLLRGAEEIGYDLGGSGLFEAAARGIRARKLSKIKAERAGREVKPGESPTGGESLNARLERVGPAVEQPKSYDDELGPDSQTGETITLREMRERVASSPKTSRDQSPEREALRRHWVDELEARQGWTETALDDVLPSGRTKRQAMAEQPDRPTGQPPLAHIVLGYPGSGKSSVIVDRVFDESPWARVLDADESKKMIPEYNGGANADGVHVESRQMNGDLLSRAATAGHDMIIPTVGGNEANLLRDYIEPLRKAGYRISLSLNDVAKEKAVERVLGRWRKRGRFVDPDVVFGEGVENPAAVYERLKAHPAVARFERWDNNADQPGGVLVERGETGGADGREAQQPLSRGRRGVREGAEGSGGSEEPPGLTPAAAGPASEVVPSLPAAPAAASPPTPLPRLVEPIDLNPATTFVPGVSTRRLDDIRKESAEVARRRADSARRGEDITHYDQRLILLGQEAEEATKAGRVSNGTPTPPPPEKKAAKAPRPVPSAGRQGSTVERVIDSAQRQRDEAAKAAAWKAELERSLEGVPRGTPTKIEGNTGTAAAEYAVLPLDRVIASNVPTELGPFSVDARHPGNERSYAPGSDQHVGVLKQAGEWNPRRVLNTDPTSVGGPPIVVPWTQELAEATGKNWEEVQGTFWTAGGNSRVMAQQLLRGRGRGAVIDAANRNAAEQFGLTPDIMGEGQLVVRVATEPVVTKEQAQKLVSQLNEVPTKALGVEEAAVSAGAKMSSDTRDWFGGIYDGDKTLRANLQNAAVARELRNRLTDDGAIDTSTRARYFRADGSLTEEGKTFVERMMLGRAVPNAALLHSAAPSTVAKIEAIATLIDRSEVGGESFDLRPRLAEIIRRQGGSALTLKQHLAQLDMLEDPPSEQVQALWGMMDELPTKELRERLGRYAETIEKRVVRTNNPGQAGFGFDDPTRIPTADEAWESAFVAMPDRPTFMTRGGVVVGSLAGGLQGVDPGIAEYLVRGTIGGASALAATDEKIDPRLRAALTAIAVIAGGPAINRAIARTGLHPGEALWRMVERGGASTQDAIFRRLSAWRGEAEAYKVMQFISYQYGMPEWVTRSLTAREVGIENESSRVLDWVNREIVQKLKPAEREQVTSLVRQVEQRRQMITNEIDRLQSLRSELREGGPGALQQSNLFSPTDPTTDAGLLQELQKARALREAETSQAWADIASNPLTKTAKRLVELEDQLADRLVAEGYDARIFERFRGVHLTRAFEKYLDPEKVPEGLSDALRDPGAAGAIRDPAYWSVARQDLDATTRAQLGEINDAAVLFAKGQTDKLHSIFTRRYFNQLQRGFAEDGLPMIAGKPVRESYLQLPNNPALGDLSGKYAHPSIGHSLLATYSPNPHASATLRSVRRWYGKGLSLWKSGKTAWSPMTQSRNFMSNAVLLHFSGVDLFDPRNNKLFFEVLRDYRNKGPIWREAQDAGVFRGSFWKAEVEDLYRAWSGSGAGTPLARLSAMAGVAPKLKRLADKPGEWYQAQEHLFKLVKYAHVKKNGGSATQASDEALKTLFDYSAVPDWVRLYRSSIFGSPFFTFTYKAVPRIAEWTAKHPDKVASLVAVFAAVEALSEKEPLPQTSPELVHPWLRPLVKNAPGVLGKPGVPFTGRQALQLPFRGEKGQALASLDFLLPTGAAMPDAPTPESKLWDAIPPALRPGNPAVTLPFELLKNRAMYSDRPLRPDAAARDGVAENIGQYYGPYAARQLAPGIASLFMDYRPGEGMAPGVAVSAAKGDIPITGLAAHLAGTKPVYMDPKRSAVIENLKLDKESDEVKADRKRELLRRKATAKGLTDEDRAEVRQKSKGRQSKIKGDRKAVREALRRARVAGY